MVKLFARIFAVIVVIPATFYFFYYTYWVVLSVEPIGESGSFTTVASTLCAVGVSLFVWNMLGAPRPGAIKSILLGAFLFGGLGFIAGFLGPVILDPSTNQGPLVGILYTGPIGFIVGGIAGLVYWFFKVRKNDKTNNAI